MNHYIENEEVFIVELLIWYMYGVNGYKVE